MKLFLERNKIYFEVIVTVLLGIMAIIVSYQANEIAKAQLQVANDEMQLHMQEHLPDIKAKMRKIINEDGDISEQVEISNTGSDLYALQDSIIAFLSVSEVQIISNNKPREQSPHLINASIPISNYPHNFTMIENPNNGKICTIEIQKTHNLDNVFEMFQKSQKSSTRSIVSFIEKYLHVTYQDKFGKEHSKYYQFGPGGDAIPMDNISGSNKFKLHQAGVEHQKYIDLNNINKEKLRSLWIEYGNDMFTKSNVINNNV